MAGQRFTLKCVVISHLPTVVSWIDASGEPVSGEGIMTIDESVSGERISTSGESASGEGFSTSGEPASGDGIRTSSSGELASGDDISTSEEPASKKGISGVIKYEAEDESWLEILFDSLHTSHGGLYTCISQINISSTKNISSQEILLEVESKSSALF